MKKRHLHLSHFYNYEKNLRFKPILEQEFYETSEI